MRSELRVSRYKVIIVGLIHGYSHILTMIYISICVYVRAGFFYNKKIRSTNFQSEQFNIITIVLNISQPSNLNFLTLPPTFLATGYNPEIL